MAFNRNEHVSRPYAVKALRSFKIGQPVNMILLSRTINDLAKGTPNQEAVAKGGAAAAVQKLIAEGVLARQNLPLAGGKSTAVFTLMSQPPI